MREQMTEEEIMVGPHTVGNDKGIADQTEHIAASRIIMLEFAAEANPDIMNTRFDEPKETTNHKKR